jgi:hypothetical protein
MKWHSELPSIYNSELSLPAGTQSWTLDLVSVQPVLGLSGRVASELNAAQVAEDRVTARLRALANVRPGERRPGSRR